MGNSEWGAVGQPPLVDRPPPGRWEACTVVELLDVTLPVELQCRATPPPSLRVRVVEPTWYTSPDLGTYTSLLLPLIPAASNTSGEVRQTFSSRKTLPIPCWQYECPQNTSSPNPICCRGCLVVEPTGAVNLGPGVLVGALFVRIFQKR